MVFYLTREFDLSDVLSVTTEHLVPDCDMKRLHDIMGFLTGDPDIKTLGLVMQADAAKEIIFKQHPELENISVPSNLPSVPSNLPEDEKKYDRLMKAWVNTQIEKFGKRISLKPTNIPLAITFDEQGDYVRDSRPDAKVLRL